jgi:hypothetical protein
MNSPELARKAQTSFWTTEPRKATRKQKEERFSLTVLPIPQARIRNQVCGLGTSKWPSEEILESLSARQSVLLPQKGIQPTRSLVNKHTEREVHSGFYL